MEKIKGIMKQIKEYRIKNKKIDKIIFIFLLILGILFVIDYKIDLKDRGLDEKSGLSVCTELLNPNDKLFELLEENFTDKNISRMKVVYENIILIVTKDENFDYTMHFIDTKKAKLLGQIECAEIDENYECDEDRYPYGYGYSGDVDYIDIFDEYVVVYNESSMKLILDSEYNLKNIIAQGLDNHIIFPDTQKAMFVKIEGMKGEAYLYQYSINLNENIFVDVLNSEVDAAKMTDVIDMGSEFLISFFETRMSQNHKYIALLGIPASYGRVLTEEEIELYKKEKDNKTLEELFGEKEYIEYTTIPGVGIIDLENNKGFIAESNEHDYMEIIEMNETFLFEGKINNGENPGDYALVDKAFIDEKSDAKIIDIKVNDVYGVSDAGNYLYIRNVESVLGSFVKYKYEAYNAKNGELEHYFAVYGEKNDLNNMIICEHNSMAIYIDDNSNLAIKYIK